MLTKVSFGRFREPAAHMFVINKCVVYMLSKSLCVSILCVIPTVSLTKGITSKGIVRPKVLLTKGIAGFSQKVSSAQCHPKQQGAAFICVAHSAQGLLCAGYARQRQHVGCPAMHITT